jgi:hypothetical protein
MKKLFFGILLSMFVATAAHAAEQNEVVEAAVETQEVVASKPERGAVAKFLGALVKTIYKSPLSTGVIVARQFLTAKQCQEPFVVVLTGASGATITVDFAHNLLHAYGIEHTC